VRVLIDECVPVQLRPALEGVEAYTVRQKRWLGRRNGALLAAMRNDGFDVLITMDRALPHQQDIRRAGISLILLSARSNRIADIEPLIPAILEALKSITPGEVVRVAAHR
jgi:rRNA-processing protein FCF1